MRSNHYKPNLPLSTLRPGLKQPLMPLRQQLDALKKQVLLFAGGRVMFDSPALIQVPAGYGAFICYGAWADAANGLWLMDGQGQWHQLDHTQAHAQEMVAGLVQKLKSIRHERSNILSEC